MSRKTSTQLYICLFLSILLMVVATPCYAYSNSSSIEDLHNRPIDTISTPDPDTKIILFSNNTWKYYRPTISRHDVLPVYRNDWDTLSLFSYKNVQLDELPQVLELKLIDSLDQFHSPVQGKILSRYGPRGRRNHNGVDIPMKTGEPIYAAFDGKVRMSTYNRGGFGNMVIVRHPNGLETWHAHLSKRNVKMNEYVKAGQVIGYVGSTGRSGGSHLHFEVRYFDFAFDPEFLFDFENGSLKYQIFALNRSHFNIRSRASELLEEEEYDSDFANSLLAAADDSTIIRAAQPTPAGSEPLYHIVRSGDMLGRIAQRYGTTITRLCQLNGIHRDATLQLRQRIRVR